MPRDNLADFLQYVGGLDRRGFVSQIAEVAETWKKSQTTSATTQKKVRKSYTREFKLQTLNLLQTGRMQKEGKWVKISKRGKLLTTY